jgi:hypothetical protein
VDPLTEHKLRLGTAVIKAQGLESIVSIVLTRSLGVSQEAGSILAGYMGLRGTIEAIKSLSDLPDYRLDAAAAKVWVRLATKASDARNGAIHSPWVAVAEHDEHTVGLNAAVSRRRAKVTRADPGKQLDQVIALIERATLDGAALSGVLVDVSGQGPD